MSQTLSNPLKKCHSYERHAHKCDGCGHVWAHDYSDPFEELIKHQDFEAYDKAADKYAVAHKCPECGSKQYQVHNGDEPIIDIYDGVTRHEPTPELIAPESPSNQTIRKRQTLRVMSDMLGGI